jgi:pimeloyl-ACP methyl ester carboxylesterase
MRAKLNGIEIEYQDGGQGSPVLLGHGYSATGRMWDSQRAALGDRYRIISWDMRGHGQTESPADPAQYSAALTVADMRALLQHCGVERAVVGGLSLGGYVSLAFYRAHPEMVRALVICDSGPGYRNAEARAAWNTRAHERAVELESKGLDALAGRSREMREAMGHHRSAQGLAHAARGMLAQQDSAVSTAYRRSVCPRSSSSVTATNRSSRRANTWPRRFPALDWRSSPTPAIRRTSTSRRSSTGSSATSCSRCRLGGPAGRQAR